MTETPEASPDIQFPVVGIGASAGGLEAIKLFLKGVPKQSGMAYIFVQHLNPAHESALTEILNREAKIPVVEVTNDVSLQPDLLYIIPPGKMLVAVDGKLKLEPRTEKTKKIKTIDLFFSSLGVVHQSFAVGIILSGTLDNGTLGLKVIKANGGITMVQDASAAFDGMPQNAIESGAADFVLPPDQMAGKLIEINKPFYEELIKSKTSDHISSADTEIFRQIINHLRVKKGVDFTHYKKGTIIRRIQRRMALNKCEKTFDYLNFVRESATEPVALVNELLISATSFFRDSKTFKVLCNTILPGLLKSKAHDATLRIWVAGCATGEEAYSVAICLQKSMGIKEEGTIKGKKVQIFATDLSETAIAKARAGIYKERDLKELPPEDVKQFFTKVDGSYMVNKLIRECCVFAQHNLLYDPPFSKIDLVSCRNLLIYLEPVLQTKALNIIHYSLREEGILLLGKSETPGTNTDLFTPYNTAEKFYTKRKTSGRFMTVTTAKREQILVDENIPIPLQSQNLFTDVYRKADQILLSKFTPPGVLVNDLFDIVQFRGNTSPWLMPPEGKPSFNLMKMARAGLSFELRNALHLSKSGNSYFEKEGILYQLDGKDTYLSISVIPLNGPEPHFLVLFKNMNTYDRPAKLRNVAKNKTDTSFIERIDHLEKELQQNREDMHAIIETQDATNEELQSANEELLSGSEELQTMNEELSTAKEELESTNEELTSLNDELLDRYEELSKSRKYTEGVFATIRDPLIVVDHEFRITKATAGFYRKFELTEKETEGKSLFQLLNNLWDIPDLRKFLENISAENSSFENFELTQLFPSIGQRTLVLNGRQLERIDGHKMILLAIEDITDRKKVEESLIALKKLNDDLERSNLELDQFAGIASHDLQEPLRKIITFIDIIREKKLSISEPAKPYIDKIAASAQRMQTIIKDLLHYSRFTNIDEPFLPTDLNDVIKKVVNDLEIAIQEKGAKIVIKKLPVVQAISVYMNQLFYNLLNNALKFSKKDVPPLIEIHSKNLSRNEIAEHTELDKHLTFTEIIVQDNGIGFHSKYAELVFKLFQRVHTQNEYPGTGIGLALCRKIVLKHGGKIYVNSMENQGTSFHIILPL